METNIITSAPDYRMLEINKLSKVYPTPNGPYVVLEDLQMWVKKGEFVSIIGHSGCGKSTLLTMIAGLNPITKGAIVLDNKTVKGPGPDRAVVFQSPSLYPWMTALDNVLLGVKQVFPHGTKKQKIELASFYLERVGLGDKLNAKTRDLSQGMQQRVGIARGLALKPNILLLDEPFGMLDSLTRSELQQVLLDVVEEESMTAIMITHDVEEAVFLSDRVVMMTSGPYAKIGDELNITYPKPRNKLAFMDTQEFYDYKNYLINFLNQE